MHRSNFVDPFSTFHFLRTYNRLVSPTDLSQYYNFALIKDSQDQQQQQQRTLVFPPSKSDIFQIPPQIYISNESTNRTFSNQSPNRTVSSTCPSTPPPPPSALSSISAPQEPVSATTSLAINSYLNDNCFEQMYNNKDGNSNSNSLDSYQCILNRRQRGEKRPIPDEQKDDKYFERRKRNNEAAKKSRDARKLREDRIAFRAAILEQENAILRAQTLALREEITTLRHMLCNNRSSGQIPVN